MSLEITPSLKTLVIRGSTWLVIGHGSVSIIRLLRSLLLTRLLFPEAFGIMSLVLVVVFGLEMLSDVGLASSIIRDKRGEDSAFLNTAWTIQVLRGLVLWLAACLIAYPAAAIYGEPLLLQLIPVVGFTAVIAGFASMSVHIHRRRMDYRRITLVEISSEVVATVAVLMWAHMHPTVWALVGGAIIGRLYSTAASHLLFSGSRYRFQYERDTVDTLIRVGKWIFLSSAFWFLAMQGDRLLLGKYLDMNQLGVYSIAVMLSEAIYALAIKITHGMMLPAYGRVVRTESGRLRDIFYRARLGLDALLVLPIASLIVLGDEVVRMLYDVRYHEAGWMLQVMCVRLLLACINSNGDVCLVALGEPKFAFMQNVCRALWIIIGIPLAWHAYGFVAVVWVVALAELPAMVVLYSGLRRYRLLVWLAEIRSLFFLAAGIIVGLGLQLLFHR